MLSLLIVSTPGSIDVAIARLEAADGQPWSAEERTSWHQRLLAARLVQLHRLAAYRDRGVFPLNEGQSARAAPIFVDRHGTDCAVGHLMRCAGWPDEVDSIARSNNLVYVPDAIHSAISAWVLTSGLTLEEAALVQPGYYWAANGQVDASAYSPGGLTLVKDGLRYSNFTLQATGATPTLAGLSLLAGQGTYNNNSSSSTPFPQHRPNGTHWIAIGGSPAYVQSPLHSLNASAAPFVLKTAVIRFDVAAIAADQRIDGISESSYSYWQGFQNLSLNNVPPAGATYSLNTIATTSDGTTSLASLQIDQSTQGGYFSRNSATQAFPANQQIHVQTTLRLQNGVAIDTYVLDFNVVTVPEPMSGFLAIMLLTGCGLRRRCDNLRRRPQTR